MVPLPQHWTPLKIKFLLLQSSKEFVTHSLDFYFKIYFPRFCATNGKNINKDDTIMKQLKWFNFAIINFSQYSTLSCTMWCRVDNYTSHEHNKSRKAKQIRHRIHKKNVVKLFIMFSIPSHEWEKKLRNRIFIFD